jgi:uncharacterized protein
MLIEFRVTNFRSFKECATLSMWAEKITSEDKTVDANNKFTHQGLNLLKSAVIYGANASGKSNLLKAFGIMRSIVLHSSAESRSTKPLPIQPYRLEVGHDEASTFEVVFLIEKVKYRYGFRASRKAIEEEWLYSSIPKGKERELFERFGDEITISKNFPEGKGLKERTRANSLFLSVVDQFNGKISGEISSWFDRAVYISSNHAIENHMLSHVEDDNVLEIVNQFIAIFDMGISKLKIEKIKQEPFDDVLGYSQEPLEVGDFLEHTNRLKSIHYSYDTAGKVVGSVEFDFSAESDGTQKIFALAIPVLESLMRGGVIWVDEIDSSLHPMLCQQLISFFSNSVANTKNAQIIFTTHNVNLLSKDRFRRDQIWFVEKSEKGESILYSLLEFKPRNDGSFAKDYLNGKFGAIPFIKSHVFLEEFTEYVEKKH